MGKWTWIAGLASIALIAACSDEDSPNGNDNNTVPADTVRVLSMVAGTWWTELSNDTIKEVSRNSGAAGVTTTTTIEEHRATYRYLSTQTSNDTTYYTFSIQDSVYVGGAFQSVDTVTTWIVQSGGKVRVFPEGVGILGLSDTLMLTAYELPMTVGNSWQSLNAAVDSVTYFDLGDWNAALAGQQAKIRIRASGTGNATVDRMVRHVLGSATLDCFEVTTDITAPFSMVVDSNITTTIGILPINIPQGTPLTTGQIDYTSTEHFSTAYTVPMYTRTVAVARDSTSVLGGLYWESGHDTTWTTARVTAYYDAATGDTLK